MEECLAGLTPTLHVQKWRIAESSLLVGQSLFQTHGVDEDTALVHPEGAFAVRSSPYTRGERPVSRVNA